MPGGPWEDYQSGSPKGEVPRAAATAEHGPWEDYSAPTEKQPDGLGENIWKTIGGAATLQTLAYSGMLGMPPSETYKHREEIEKFMTDAGAGAVKNISTDLKVGSKNSIFGIAYTGKLPPSLQSTDTLDKFVSGLTTMTEDLPFYLMGGTVGGAIGAIGGPIGAGAGSAMGAFAVPDMIREDYIQSIRKGEIKSFSDLMERVTDVGYAGLKGATTGVAVEASGGTLPMLANSPLTASVLSKMQQISVMTIFPKALEGQIPSAEDFGVNAALFAAMHYGMGSFGKAEDTAARIHRNMMDAYAKGGSRPIDITAEALRRAQTDPTEDAEDRFNEILQEMSPDKPTEEAGDKSKPKEAPVVPESPPQGLRPAVKVGDEVTIGKEGETHSDIKGDDEGERGFVDRDDNFHTRDEARAWLRENDPETHKAWEKVAGDPEAEFHSEDYNEAHREATTGIKNAAVDVQRAERGLPPIDSSSPTSREDAWAQAKEDVDSGKLDPERIAKSVNEHPRGLSTEETDALNYYNRQLSNQHKSTMDVIERARANDDDVAEQTAKEKLQDIEDKRNAVEQAVRKSGSEWGKTGRARQDMIREDYSLANMLQRARVASPTGEVSPAIREKLENLSDQLEKANKKLEEYQTKQAQFEAQYAVDKIKETTARETRKGARKQERSDLKTEYDQYVKNLDKILVGRMSSNPFFDPEVIGLMGKMAKNRIETGISKIEDIVDDIHGALTAIGHNVTKRDIRDAISGYGKTIEMSKEAVDVALREARRQGKLISSLEDAQAKALPLRSGLQRDAASDRVRELQRQVKQAMKESGIDAKTSMSPERQWKTSLDAVKTRLRNQIADLAKQLKTGEKTPAREGVAYDEEANILKGERDSLRKTLQDIEGKPKMSPEQKIKMATAAVEKSIAEYERRIKENDLTPAQKSAGALETPALRALREQRDSLKETFRQMKEAATPKKSPEEIALDRYKTYTKNRIADMESRIESGDFSKEPQRQTVLDSEAQELKTKAAKVRNQMDEAIAKQKMEARTTPEKVADFLVKWRRAGILTGWHTLGKLTNAAMLRMGSTFVEEMQGGVLSHMPYVKDISSRAAFEGGGLNVPAEISAISQFFQKATAEDIWSELKEGKTSLDELYDPKSHMPRTMLDFIGNLHGALKVLPVRAEFFRRFEKGMEYAKQNNLDINDPRVQTAVATQAYEHSLRAKLMQENVITSAYQVMLSYLHNRGASGKTLEAATRFALPIVKVPTNFVAETMQYTPANLAWQTYQMFKVLGDENRMGKSAFDNLSMHDMDNIMRGLKKGSVGLALMAMGFAFRNNITGYSRTEVEKKHGVKLGTMKIGGVEIPTWLNDAPPLMTLQLGATVGHVWDHYNMKGMSGGLVAGALQGGLEMAKRVPFLEEPSRIAGETRTPEQSMVGLGEMGGSMVVPLLVNQIAQATDPQKGRKARTPMEAVEMQIPGLRENVKHFSIRRGR
jgi:hypothetical protein